MKIWMFIPAALLLGLLIGGWAPRVDLLKARKEIQELKKARQDSPRGRGEVDGVIHMLGIKGKPGSPDARRHPPVTLKSSGAATSGATHRPITPDRASGDASGNTPTNSASRPVSQPDNTLERINQEAGETDPDPQDMQKRIEEAAELWKTRSEIARATTIANLGLDSQQAVQFDVLVGAMNMRIGHALNNLAESLQKEEELTPESGIRVANEVTGAIVLGYQEMDRLMPGEWRESTGNAFSLTDFIDPGVAKPLIQVQDKLNAPGRDPHRPHIFGRQHPPKTDSTKTVTVKD